MHHVFESTVARFPNSRCLGARPWVPSTKSWADHFDWLTYAEVAQRRKHFGAGLVEIHHRAGLTQDKYGVGLWAQNRPEWHLTGLSLPRIPSLRSLTLPSFRPRPRLPVPLHRLAV